MREEMIKVKLSEIANIRLAIPSKCDEYECRNSKWIMASSLLENNAVGEILETNLFKENEDLLLESEDILIKRIFPQFVSYCAHSRDLECEKIYIGPNLLIVRAKENVVSSYLACLLEDCLPDLLLEAKGAVMPSIGNKALSELKLNIIVDRNKQEKIGTLWLLSNEKYKLQTQLAKIEKEKVQAHIKSIIKQNGDKNGK